MGAAIKKHPAETLLESIPKEKLNKPLTHQELAVISKHLLDWPTKAVSVFGLPLEEVENIRENRKNSHEGQKMQMMIWWGDNCERGKNTLRELILVSQEHGLMDFIQGACESLGYLKSMLEYKSNPASHAYLSLFPRSQERKEYKKRFR